jgi:hypothetical protein
MHSVLDHKFANFVPQDVITSLHSTLPTYLTVNLFPLLASFVTACRHALKIPSFELRVPRLLLRLSLL